MKIMKNICKLTFINGYPDRETSSERYKEIIKDSVNYTSFKHLFPQDSQDKEKELS